jgi:adenine phosphoribosyltransferase
MLENKINAAVRDVPNFPKEGILFKDITPILQDPVLCEEIVQAFCDKVQKWGVTVVVGIESRGFFFGPSIAQKLKVPFVPIRKKGKLPYKTISVAYDLEYGDAVLAMHVDAIKPGGNVLIHDDVLATGGTALGAVKLLELAGAKVAGYSFLIELMELKGKEKLLEYSENYTTITVSGPKISPMSL